MECALGTFGRLDILVNNAGVLDMAPLLEASDEHIDRTLATHLRGAFSVTRPALRLMLEQGYGRIVNTSSGAVLGSPVGVAYQSAKAGIIGFTRAVALLGKDSNVKANAVLPTAFTRMTDSIPDPAFRAFMEERFVPERVAGAVALMCHETFAPSGECFLAGGGRMARLFLAVTPGYSSRRRNRRGLCRPFGRCDERGGFHNPGRQGSGIRLVLAEARIRVLSCDAVGQGDLTNPTQERLAVRDGRACS